MSKEEYENEKVRVDTYDILNNRKKRLSSEKLYISDGILSIIAAYQKEITYNTEYDLKRKIVSAICNVYDEELEQIEKDINNL